jgi:hypothetical protein
MPDAMSCPCGAEPTDPDGFVAYLTDTLLDLIFTGVLSKLKYLGVLAGWIGSPIDVASICASPKVRQPTWTLEDFAFPNRVWVKAGQMLYARLYELNCTCLTCPPATTCNTGTCVVVTPDDGYPRPGFEEEHRQYHVDVGSEIWVARGDGVCIGLLNGVLITWTGIVGSDPPTAVQVCEGGGTNCSAYVTTAVGNGLTLCYQTVDAPPDEPIPEAPDEVEDWYGPAPCSNADICATLAHVSEMVRRVEFLTTVIAGPLYGITAPIDVTMPGLSAPLSGTLSEVLGRALTGLAPIQQTQLSSPATTVINVSSVIDVEGAAYAHIEPTVIPTTMGYRGGGDTQIYYATGVAFALGWVVIMGEDGVLGHQNLVYPSGLEMVLPSTATALAIHLEPGVEVDVTTWQRTV